MRSQRPAPCNRWRTSAAVAGSGTHGPEPIEARSSPMTSDTTQTADAGRRQCQGEAPGAPSREPLSDPVHGGDVEAGAEEHRVEGGQVGGGQPLDRRARAGSWHRRTAGPRLRRRRRRVPRPRRAPARRPVSRAPARGGPRRTTGRRGCGDGAGAGGTTRPPAGSWPQARSNSTAASAMGRAALPSARIHRRRVADRSSAPEPRTNGRPRVNCGRGNSIEIEQELARAGLRGSDRRRMWSRGEPCEKKHKVLYHGADA